MDEVPTSLSQLLSQASRKSSRLREGLKSISQKLGIPVNDCSINSGYVVQLKHPFCANDSFNDSTLKIPLSNRGLRHKRSLTEAASDTEHTPRSNAEPLKSWKWDATSDGSHLDMRIEEAPEKNEVSKATSMVMAEKEDESESECE